MNTWITKNGIQIHRIICLYANVYMVTGHGHCLLVDTGPVAFQKFLARQLRRMDIYRIHGVILTHTHYDHAGNAAFLQKNFGSRIMVHPAEAGYLKKGLSSVPGGITAFAQVMERLASGIEPKMLEFPPCEPDKLPVSEFNKPFFDMLVTVMATPGHSPGSVSVVVDREVALVGDCMFGVVPGKILPPFGDDVSQIISSWQQLLATGCDIFLPGHGFGVSGPAVEKNILSLSS
ncbi:MAG: MBL fold metallo-hydrolase [Desulfotignum sp.]|nr:MBL fold metallo-hydrolase [Desulfotignum sp.]MCF8124958.1 MBL fold metallo-hydrolase [Desulfotignum sp.]